MHAANCVNNKLKLGSIKVTWLKNKLMTLRTGN